MMFRIKRQWTMLAAALSAGIIFQSGCPLSADFDPITLFALTASTVITDTIFFALDSFLISAS